MDEWKNPLYAGYFLFTVSTEQEGELEGEQK